jgi:hypothetical protein
MKPEELAKRLTPEYQTMRQTLMQRIVLVVQGNVQRRTHVLTGNLRRSWTSRVEKSGERGVVGTTVVYARYQRNQPAEEGLEDSLTTIQQLAQEAGEQLFTRVSR